MISEWKAILTKMINKQKLPNRVWTFLKQCMKASLKCTYFGKCWYPLLDTRRGYTPCILWARQKQWTVVRTETEDPKRMICRLNTRVQDLQSEFSGQAKNTGRDLTTMTTWNTRLSVAFKSKNIKEKILIDTILSIWERMFKQHKPRTPHRTKLVAQVPWDPTKTSLSHGQLILLSSVPAQT